MSSGDEPLRIGVGGFPWGLGVEVDGASWMVGGDDLLSEGALAYLAGAEQEDDAGIAQSFDKKFVAATRD
jgi:hypothetical protein